MQKPGGLTTGFVFQLSFDAGNFQLPEKTDTAQGNLYSSGVHLGILGKVYIDISR